MKKQWNIKILLIRLLIGIIIFSTSMTILLHFVLKSTRLGLTVLDIYSQSLPKTDHIKGEYPNEFLTKQTSYFEKQGKSECGGYSSAYVLRCLGEDITGKDNYQQLGHKFTNGYVMPQALLDIFRNYGYKAKLYRGDMAELKTRLSKGVPIIIIIGQGRSWQHYVTVVGYDENNILLYDSNKDTNNAKGYNRIMSNTEFISQWKNKIPLFEKTYFVID